MVRLNSLLCSLIALLIEINRNSIDADRPSYNGRHQLRPKNRELLMDIQEAQLEFEKYIEKRDSNEVQVQIQIRRQVNNQCDVSVRCVESKYRTADGSCNNKQNPKWGKSMECSQRLLPPDYSDRMTRPRASLSGRPLPNARHISSQLHFQREVYGDYTHILMQWGQFLDHDMSFVPTFQSRQGVIDCCEGSGSENCFAIPIRNDDPFYSRFGRTCMGFVRSAPCLTCNVPRQQINQLTSFIDASNVYGNMANETIPLRRMDGTGKLRTSKSNRGNDLLPPSSDPQNDQCSDVENNNICFEAGDNRVNQLPALTAMHTLFLREHNRICNRLKILNPHWGEERLFQEARRIVGAEMQMITYNEFVPLVIGAKNMNAFHLWIRRSGRTTYDPNLNPSIINEFSAAAFRFGHSTVNGLFHLMDERGQTRPYLLRENYFNPFVLYNDDIDLIIRGLIGVRGHLFDRYVTDDVRNHLYKSREDRFGSDLIAFNIQRGRDHGIPGYVFYLRYCFDEQITEFAQLDAYMPREQWTRYSQLYERVEDIDLYSGGLSEYKLPDAIVGPTFACIISKQFYRLKFGDRFWFEHGDQIGSFNEGQLRELRKVSLANIICRNGDNFPEVHQRVMQVDNSNSNPVVSCSSIKDMNFNAWKE
ncbi:Peroxidase-like protein [Dinothrombium tinctorium]|uniref:Peroxidase-like protein n=1 Tax=Dinothrombium tinctorium TaxID=1965070 RepID=A0A443QT09_9ACAR|nr:Peroxidase-like protein [Dinothrombium tinctorium]